MSTIVVVTGEVINTYTKGKTRKIQLTADDGFLFSVFLGPRNTNALPVKGNTIVVEGVLGVGPHTTDLTDAEDCFYVHDAKIQHVEAAVEKFTFLGEEYIFTKDIVDIDLMRFGSLQVQLAMDGTYTAHITNCPSGDWDSGYFPTIQEAVDAVVNDITENFKLIANFLQYDVEE